MKALEIRIKEFKKLKNIEKELAGNHILLLGDNGVGKSSFIQFMEIALGKTTNIPPNIVGGGEVVIDLKGNPVTFSVTFKEGKPIIKVKGNGISIDNNKSSIAQLIGVNSFNPEHFVNLSKTKAGRKEQIELFKSFLPDETKLELSTFESNLRNKTEERTELGRDIEKLKGSCALNELNNLPDFELEKFTSVDTSALMKELNTINDSNKKITDAKRGVESIIENNKSIEQRILELQEELLKNKERIKNGEEWLSVNKIVDVSEITSKIENSDKNNAKAISAKNLLSERKKLETLQNEYGEMTVLIETTREAIANAIRDMDSPIEGLMYDDEQLVWNNIPVNPDSLSKSEIMELGIRLKLAENPENIIFIQEAESIGTERFELIKQIAEKNNCQIIAEQVQRGTKELLIEIMED